MAEGPLETIEFRVTLCPRDDHPDGTSLTKKKIDYLVDDFRLRLTNAAQKLGGAWVYLASGPIEQEQQRRR